MNAAEIKIDGSQGEGGGQVLRTSLSLAAALGRPVTVENVRGRRRKPGLLRQHRTALRAVRDITSGTVEGDDLGSTTVRFVPGAPPRAGEYRVGIGSAGSTTLVLQTMLPPLLLAGGPSSVVLEGGTHNPMAPPFDFLAESFAPCLAAMGAKIEATLVRPGFFPAGGGELRVTCEPTEEPRPLRMLERGKAGRMSLEVVLAGGLPENIAEREWKAFQKSSYWSRDRYSMVRMEGGRGGGGNLMLARLRHGEHTTVLTSFGMRERSSEAVGNFLGREVQHFEASDTPVDAHLADQLMLPMALLGGGTFRAATGSEHARTNADVINSFLPGAVTLEGGEGPEPLLVTVAPHG